MRILRLPTTDKLLNRRFLAVLLAFAYLSVWAWSFASHHQFAYCKQASAAQTALADSESHTITSELPEHADDHNPSTCQACAFMHTAGASTLYISSSVENTERTSPYYSGEHTTYVSLLTVPSNPRAPPAA